MAELTIGSLCTGYGGLEMGVQAVLGGRLEWLAEHEPATEKAPKPTQAAARLLAYRYPNVPNLGDITRVDWGSVAPVDVLTGGTPCQDVTHAGKRAGMRAGTRSGIWSSMVDAVDALQPRLVVWENVRGVLSAEADSDLERCPICVGDGSGDALRALGRVLGDLADSGYDARWCGLPASAVGAPHKRFRVFVVAYPSGQGWQGSDESGGAWPESVLGSVAGCGGVAADADRLAVREQPVAVAGSGGAAVAGWRREAVTDTEGIGRGEGRPEPAGQFGRPDAAFRSPIDWAQFAPAIERWERILGRSAPAPTAINGRYGPKLSAEFDEWLMGLPAGWVSEVPGISWNDKLKICGNGVVPQQAAAALRHLLDIEEVLTLVAG